MGRISTIRLIACAAGVAFVAVYLHAGDLPPIQPTTSPNASVAVPRDVYKWLERAEADVALIQDPKAKLDEAIRVKGSVRPFYLGAPPLADALLRAHREDQLWEWAGTIDDPKTRASLEIAIALQILTLANPQLQNEGE